MINEKIGVIFEFLPETNLTEQDFYEMKGDYPVYSGQTENKGIITYINTYNQDKACITFTTYGSAGKLNYREGKFTIGRNCMGLRPKKEYKKDIIVEWFAYKFQNLFYRLRIGDPHGQKSLNRMLIENVEVIIPDKDIQEKQLKLYRKLQNLLSIIDNVLKKLDEFSRTNIEIENFIYEEKIEKIFDMAGGNSGLTEDFVYNNQPTNEEESIKILSGATIESNILGYVNKNSKPNNRNLKIFKAPFIQIVRKGLAGCMTYFNSGKFTANDDIYILTIKKEWWNKINLKWFAYQYQELFYNLVTSKSDNATFNKKYAEKQKVKMSDIKFQNNITEKLLKIDDLIGRLERIKEEIEKLMEYEIIT